jgi:hypothetical protein
MGARFSDGIRLERQAAAITAPGTNQVAVTLDANGKVIAADNNGATAYLTRYQAPDHWTVFGHSYVMYGFGTFYQTGRMDALFRSAMDIEYGNWKNYAKDGARLSIQNFAEGGYTKILQACTRPLRGGQPYAPDGGAYLLCYGINDIGTMSGTQTEIRTAFKHALRTAISRCRASTIFENDVLIGTRTAYGAGFSVAGATRDFSSGTTVHLASTTTAATVTMTLPSDYNGEDVAIQFISNGGVFGGTVTFSGTAGVTGTLSTSAIINSGNLSHAALVKRVTNLTSSNAGQTIIATVTALDASGSVIFDSWWLESNWPQPVIVCNVARLLTAGYASYANVPTDTDVANINSDITSIVAEFDSMVQIADIDTAMGKAAANFATDGVHPNEIGAARCVEACFTALNKLVPTDPIYPTINFNNSSPRSAAMRRPRVSGYYYGPEGSDAILTGSPSAGDQWAFPVQITEGRERWYGLATRLAIGGSVAGTIRWGIYDDPGYVGYPQALVIEATAAGALSLGTAAGIVKTPVPAATGSLNVVLDPGLYWITIKLATAGTGQTFEYISGPDRSMTIPQLDKTTLATFSGIAWKLTGQGSTAFPGYFPDISSATLDSSGPKIAALQF